MAQPQQSFIRIVKDPECTLVEFTEKHIIDEVVIRQIGNELTKLVDDSPRPRIVVTFKGVEHLSSAALGTLLTVMNRVKAKAEDKGVTILIDPKAILFLLGTQMDFQTSKLSSGFVFNNPNQTSACGCGESVTIQPAAEEQ